MGIFLFPWGASRTGWKFFFDIGCRHKSVIISDPIAAHFFLWLNSTLFFVSEPFDKKKNSHSQQNSRRRGIIRHCMPSSCVHLSADLDDVNAEELQTNIDLATTANYVDTHFTYHSQSSVDNQNLFIEQSLQSRSPAIGLAEQHPINDTNRDCLQPYRFPRCKFHHKRNRHRPSAPVERIDNSFERSIIVVADVPVDNFEKMIEDVV